MAEKLGVTATNFRAQDARTSTGYNGDIGNHNADILRAEPAQGQQLDVEENGERFKFDYHEVYTDGKYIYDPPRPSSAR